MLFPLSFFLFQLVVSEVVGFSLLFIFGDAFSFFPLGRGQTVPGIPCAAADKEWIVAGFLPVLNAQTSPIPSDRSGPCQMLEASGWELETQITAWLCQGNPILLQNEKRGVDAAGLREEHV